MNVDSERFWELLRHGLELLQTQAKMAPRDDLDPAELAEAVHLLDRAEAICNSMAEIFPDLLAPK